MLINNIKLQNFRNYDLLDLNLSKGINVFYGDNAQGKTNILESIFMCSIGRSFRTNKEKEIIKFGENFTKINIEFNKNDRSGVIYYELSEKKYVSVNGIKLKKLSELLGNVNVVIFTPDDINIIKGRTKYKKKIFRYNDRSIKACIYL